MSVVRTQFPYPLVAVAIDNDNHKITLCALKWALESLVKMGQTIVLVHVNTKGTSSGSYNAAGYCNQPEEPASRDLFIPYRIFCKRKDVSCRDIIIDDMDVTRALTGFIESSAIEKMVLGSPRKGMLRRLMNSLDVPQRVSIGAPDFCTVYTIGKYTVYNIRTAIRAAPYVSPLHPYMSNPNPSAFKSESSRALEPLEGLSQIQNNKLPACTDAYRNESNAIPHVYVARRDPNSTDMKELNRSTIVTIERNAENYVCIHNVLKLMNKNMDIKLSELQWRPYNENKFLITFETEMVRDSFVRNNSALHFGKTCIRFKAFELNDKNKIHPMTFKVWVVIKGLPVQHLCYKTAEIVASRFGKLYACDLQKKESFIGSFRIMVDCTDITNIPPSMIFHFEDDGETTIELQKEYVCSIDAYQAMNFDEQVMNFEEVMHTLLDANKLTPLS